jgi:hypothetical protein
MFKKATKSQSRLRAALFGPSGSGKTFTALRIATGIGGRIAVIDTERYSAAKYADRFTFDSCDLADRSIAGYVAAIKAAADAGYQVLVIDSLSHGWQELMEQVDRIAKAKYRGNSWSAWSEATPQQRSLVDAILRYPGHVLATMRSKTEWQTTSDAGGKARPVRVGLAPEQGKGIEYEFDLLIELSTEHVANVIKDRTGRYQDKLIELPGEPFGRELAAWLSDGEPAAPLPYTDVSPGDADEIDAVGEELARLLTQMGQAATLAAVVEASRKRVGDDRSAIAADLGKALREAKANVTAEVGATVAPMDRF